MIWIHRKHLFKYLIIIVDESNDRKNEKKTVKSIQKCPNEIKNNETRVCIVL